MSLGWKKATSVLSAPGRGASPIGSRPFFLAFAKDSSISSTLVLSITSFAIMFLALSYKLKLIGENEIKLVKSFLPF